MREASRNHVLSCLRDSVSKLKRSRLHYYLERGGSSRLPQSSPTAVRLENQDETSEQGKFTRPYHRLRAIDIGQPCFAQGKMTYSRPSAMH